MAIVLHQFEFSHFNEKARWALAWKGLECERRSYLPGPHMAPIRKLSGQMQVPVLEIDGEVVPGSAAIIDRLERSFPEPALYPSEPDVRAEALAIQRRFDAEVGPATRTALFSELLPDGAYFSAMFGRKASASARSLYRAAFPVTRLLIARNTGASDPANVARAFEVTEAALDEVATRAAATGHLVGDRFSVADLTAAALLCPIANPAHPDMAKLEPIPERYRALLARFSEHPGMAWVTRMYAEHRT